LLEALDPRGAVARAAVQLLVADAIGDEPRANQGEERRELREDDRFLALLEHARELREERVELGALCSAVRGVEERRVASRLAQAEEGLEHVHRVRLALGPAFARQ